jgi:transcriptional regulator with XRE-family HTH domain
MEMTNEKLRQQFSARLKKEFQRTGLPVSSPTQIAQEFNRRYPATQVTAQSLRKWLLAEAIPTQAKLIALADWLSVSPQWLRFGTGVRRVGEGSDQASTETASHRGVIVIGKDQAALVSVVDLLTQLSEGNLRLVENIVRCVLREQEER